MKQILFFIFFIISINCNLKKSDHRNCGDLPPQIIINNRLKISEKVWLHRTNSIFKFQRNYNNYCGFELDINIDTAGFIFDVYHAPVKSTHLSFEHYLRYDLKKQKNFWLDIKNGNKNNIEHTISILKLLDNRYQIKHRIILESKNPAFLSRLSEEGYLTSLFITNNLIKQYNTPAQIFKQVSALLYKGCNTFSFDGRHLPLLKNAFPKGQFMVWSLNPFRNLIFNEKKNNIKDPNVLIVLESEFL